MEKAEILALFKNIGTAASRITGDRQNHIIAVAIMQDCEQAVCKLSEENYGSNNENNS